MTKIELGVIQKLANLRIAADGKFSGGVSINTIVSWFSNLDSQKVVNRVQAMANGSEPIEKCQNGNYRLTSMSEAKRFTNQNRPIMWWT